MKAVSEEDEPYGNAIEKDKAIRNRGQLRMEGGK